MRLKSLGMRPKTLRSSISATPASLHLEMTMLLHQERRLHSELEMIKTRAALLSSMFEKTHARIDELRTLSGALDPEGKRLISENTKQPKEIISSSPERVPKVIENGASQSNFTSMSLEY